MIKLDLEIMEEVLTEYENDSLEFTKRASKTFNDEINGYLNGTTIVGIMNNTRKESIQFCLGFIIALMMVQYQQIKDQTEDLEKLLNLKDDRKDKS